ncbi:hypothetical protein LDJ94_01290 [Fusobacterium nucleatum]|uniref:hypothetical protein n=1 Tax=Fusobacterium nucleatum TaxID=851 RepID=UPI0030D242AB
MLPKNGTISMDDIRKELKVNSTISLNDTAVRKLADKSDGTISLSDFYGKSNSEVIFDGAMLVKDKQDWRWTFNVIQIPSYPFVDKIDMKELVCEMDENDDLFYVRFIGREISKYNNRNFYVIFPEIKDEDNITPMKFNFKYMSSNEIAIQDEPLYDILTSSFTNINEHFFVKIYVE